jgi:hypothetical protein
MAQQKHMAARLSIQNQHIYNPSPLSPNTLTNPYTWHPHYQTCVVVERRSLGAELEVHSRTVGTVADKVVDNVVVVDKAVAGIAEEGVVSTIVVGSSFGFGEVIGSFGSEVVLGKKEVVGMSAVVLCDP